MRVILTLIYAALLVSTQTLPAGASMHAAMYCWVPDFEIAVACDDDDEGGSDGDEFAENARAGGPRALDRRRNGSAQSGPDASWASIARAASRRTWAPAAQCSRVALSASL